MWDQAGMPMTNQTKIVLFALAFASHLAGCASPDRHSGVPGEPSVLTQVPGERDDVERSLGIALEAAEAAGLGGGWNDDEYYATFLAVEDRLGWVRATDLGDGTLELRAFFRPNGVLAAQEKLLRAWARRLDQLNGVEWAPR